MGKLIYGSHLAELQIDDRTLHHLRVVITAKFRRGEAFQLIWESTRDQGSGHEMLWMHPAVPLHMKFQGNRTPTLNRAWIDALMLTANDAGGLRQVAEPDSATSTNASRS